MRREMHLFSDSCEWPEVKHFAVKAPHLSQLMGVCISRRNDELYQPREYKEDCEIPFAPDGNAPLICDCVERVKGTSGPFRGLKCVRKTIITPSGEDSSSQDDKKRKLIQEAKILHYARHHHVIRLIHTYFKKANEEEIKFAVIMDRADGNLHEYLKPGKTPSKRWFGCLIGVIHHIHTLGIRHRDIKPSNILIKDQQVLLADFGISQMGLGKTMPTTNLQRNSQRTREYCAPEVDEGRTRGRSADIFSLGAVFLEMLVAHTYPDGYKELGEVLKTSSSQTSSYAKNILEIHEWIHKNLHPIDWQATILSSCQRMLHPDRSQRPVAEELDSIWSSFSASGECMACNCESVAAMTEDNKLVEACTRGSKDDVERLLKAGADPNTISAIHHAAAPLHCAARNGHEDVIKLLLKNGANVNAKDENEQTALHGAAGQGCESIIRVLLEGNAEVDTEDLDGDTAFHFAARRDHFNVLDLLERH
ncbi:Pc06g02120 [Penicillium rubens Wisconsin 54-1255]|uniref:Pc06g02120 protein n=1 Tax=Penicillium rubens (strain ATCC 28089 / DSM 1075 / NRRL 1951 / Wisconsin 54-1255) TaxID=500485 RepID=B6GWB3_PENRW|nr:Pc06g02120 [Penicillium rubens Wisconsin 54-1255]